MKQGRRIVLGFVFDVAAARGKEHAITVSRLRRTSKELFALTTPYASIDGSNLVELADALERIATIFKRAKASAHSNPKPKGEK